MQSRQHAGLSLSLSPNMARRIQWQLRALPVSMMDFTADEEGSDERLSDGRGMSPRRAETTALVELEMHEML